MEITGTLPENGMDVTEVGVVSNKKDQENDDVVEFEDIIIEEEPTLSGKEVIVLQVENTASTSNESKRII